MAKFHTYAEEVTTEHVSWVAYTSGVRKNPPGYPIKALLERNGGKYVETLYLTEGQREDIRTVAQLTKDEELMKVANAPEVVISLEHLRHLNPETRIVSGYWLEYTPEEKQYLGITEYEPANSANTIRVNKDPAKPWRIAKG